MLKIMPVFHAGVHLTYSIWLLNECYDGKYLLNWRPPSLSVLIPMLSNIGLIHLGSDAFNYKIHYSV